MSRWLVFFAAVLVTGCQSMIPAGTITRERIAEIIASPDRSDADRTNDRRRRPDLMLAFIGLRPGNYAQLPKNPARVEARAKNPGLGQIVPVVRSFDDPVPADISANALDLVTLMFNYHDFGHLGVDRARLNRAVFAALKPGGMYVIADHSGRPGTGISESGTLHRIEEAFLRKEVEAAGFRLAEEGNFLRNPNDPRDRETPEPPMPKDEFVLKFIKP
jgi:predicted methyltransferase